MTEIQLKNIVDRLGKETVTGTDGDEFTIKDEIKVSKFSKEAMEIGFDVSESLKTKVYEQFTSYVGEDSVFPTKNGSPKILTKFLNHPYSYELLPEYERGERKMPCTKAMNWEGKIYNPSCREVLQSKMHFTPSHRAQIGTWPIKERSDLWV
jgi:hypothetical protein